MTTSPPSKKNNYHKCFICKVFSIVGKSSHCLHRPPRAIWQDVLEHPDCYFLLSNSFFLTMLMSSFYLPLISLTVLSICYQHAQSTDSTSLLLRPRSRHLIGLRGPGVSLCYLLHLMDSTVTVHCSITQAVTWRQSPVLLLLLSLHIKLAQKDQCSQISPNPQTICTSLYANMGGVPFSSAHAWCSCRCIFLLGKIILHQQLYFITFLTMFLFISYITSVYLIKLVISLASIWHQCSLREHLLLKSDLIRKRQIKLLFAD